MTPEEARDVLTLAREAGNLDDLYTEVPGLTRKELGERAARIVDSFVEPGGIRARLAGPPVLVLPHPTPRSFFYMAGWCFELLPADEVSE